MSIPHPPPQGAPLQEFSEDTLRTTSYEEQMHRRFNGTTFLTSYHQDNVEYVAVLEKNALQNIPVKVGRDDNRL